MEPTLLAEVGFVMTGLSLGAAVWSAFRANNAARAAEEARDTLRVRDTIDVCATAIELANSASRELGEQNWKIALFYLPRIRSALFSVAAEFDREKSTDVTAANTHLSDSEQTLRTWAMTSAKIAEADIAAKKTLDRIFKAVSRARDLLEQLKMTKKDPGPR